jgi:hypothetical protein
MNDFAISFCSGQLRKEGQSFKHELNRSQEVQALVILMVKKYFFNGSLMLTI